LETEETKSASPAPSVIGGRYVVERLLARGGMAVVYLARHAELNRQVAIKVLEPPEDGNPAFNFEERFIIEARVLAGLNHPHIVTLHDFGRLDNGTCYLAMEFVDGPRLSDVLRAGPLEQRRTLRLMAQVCTALHAAHARGVVHRDLKPSNLLITTDDAGAEVVKVVDFGIAKLQGIDNDTTIAGMVLGSPHCMAPEQIHGSPCDVRTDVYAVGVLLYRCLTGRFPFHAENPAATMVGHISGVVPSFHDVAPLEVFPDGLEAVVRRCLEKQPAARWPDIEALLAALIPFLDRSDITFTGTIGSAALRRQIEAHQAAQRGSTAERPWLAYAGIALGVAMAFSAAAITMFKAQGAAERAEAAAALAADQASRPSAAAPDAAGRAGTAPPSPAGGVPSEPAGGAGAARPAATGVDLNAGASAPPAGSPPPPAESSTPSKGTPQKTAPAPSKSSPSSAKGASAPPSRPSASSAPKPTEAPAKTPKAEGYKGLDDW
jgi:hypothetical protein